MRRLIEYAVAVVIAFVAVIGLLVFLQSRDESTLDRPAAAVQGGERFADQGARHRAAPAGFSFASDPPTSGPHLPKTIRRDASTLTRDEVLHALELGDVVLRYGDRADQPALRGLQDDLSGPFDTTLARAGQAVVLQYAPRTDGVIALAWRRLLRARSPSEPALRAFAEAWLGRGARG